MMPRFIAVHTAPFTEDNFYALAKEVFPEGVSWKNTYCDFDDNKFFCEWESPGKEMLEQGFAQRGIPYDAIYPVRLFNPGTSQFE